MYRSNTYVYLLVRWRARGPRGHGKCKGPMRARKGVTRMPSRLERGRWRRRGENTLAFGAREAWAAWPHRRGEEINPLCLAFRARGGGRGELASEQDKKSNIPGQRPGGLPKYYMSNPKTNTTVTTTRLPALLRSQSAALPKFLYTPSTSEPCPLLHHRQIVTIWGLCLSVGCTRGGGVEWRGVAQGM
jgi:hypothetical protein